MPVTCSFCSPRQGALGNWLVLWTTSFPSLIPPPPFRDHLLLRPPVFLFLICLVVNLKSCCFFSQLKQSHPRFHILPDSLVSHPHCWGQPFSVPCASLGVKTPSLDSNLLSFPNVHSGKLPSCKGQVGKNSLQSDPVYSLSWSWAGSPPSAGSPPVPLPKLHLFPILGALRNQVGHRD